MITKAMELNYYSGAQLPVAHVGGGLTGQAPQDEEKQLVVVPLVRQVPANDEVLKLSMI